MSEGRGGSQPEVTVAVVSWNTRALLADCLASLQDDFDTGLADVWVVDNNSSDGSPELVRESFPWTNLIASSENLGFGNAVNAVAARTSTQWLVPANADVHVAQGALRSLLDEGAQHPEAAVFAPRLVLPDGSTQRSVYPFPTIPFTVAYVSGLTRLSSRLARHWFTDGGFDPERPGQVPWAVGAFLLVRRSAWLEVGGFDHKQWMYAEDLDLGWRLQQAGWRARYVPRARVGHAESAATKAAWGDARHLQWHACTYAWMMRRRGLVMTRLVAAINVGGFLLRALVFSPIARLGVAKAQQLRHDSLNSAHAHSIGLRPRSVLDRIA